jgi:ABC-type metal ion transport system, periplasmic component/surface antigen
MKKIMALLLALVMVFALCACGKKVAPANNTFVMGIDAEYPPSATSEMTANIPDLTLRSAKQPANCSDGSSTYSESTGMRSWFSLMQKSATVYGPA